MKEIISIYCTDAYKERKQATKTLVKNILKKYLKKIHLMRLGMFLGNRDGDVADVLKFTVNLEKWLLGIRCPLTVMTLTTAGSLQLEQVIYIKLFFYL